MGYDHIKYLRIFSYSECHESGLRIGGRFMSDLFVRERPVKKHTRSVKETLIIYAIGVFVCVYLGFLLGE